MLGASNLWVQTRVGQTNFAKKKMGPKTFWVKPNLKFHVKKAVGQKSCELKKVRSKDNLDPKVWIQQHFYVQKISKK